MRQLQIVTFLCLVLTLAVGCAPDPNAKPREEFGDCPEEVRSMYWQGIKNGQNANEYSIKVEALYQCKLF